MPERWSQDSGRFDHLERPSTHGTVAAIGRPGRGSRRNVRAVSDRNAGNSRVQDTAIKTVSAFCMTGEFGSWIGRFCGALRSVNGRTG